MTPARPTALALSADCPLQCAGDTAFIYIFAQFCGGAVAALLALPLWGPGPEYGAEAHEVQALRAEAGGPPSPGAGLPPIKAHHSERQGLTAVEMTADGSAALGAEPGWQARF